MKQRSFGIIALSGIFLALGCMTFEPVLEQDPPEKKKDDPEKKDDAPEKKVGPILKRLQELKAKREAEQEARLREQLDREIEKEMKLKEQIEKLQKAREERELKDKPKEKAGNPEIAKAGSLASWIEKSAAAFKSVKDYTCVFIKQERIGNKLLDEQSAELSVREAPFSIYLRFISPKSVNGQEACYIAGKNDGKVRVKGAGLKGLVGWLTLPPDDPKILAENRHSVVQAGIGRLIEQMAAVDKKHLKSKILVSEVQWEKRDCIKFEVTLEEKNPDVPLKSAVYFDKELKLPVRIENYETAKKGKGEWDLLEMYSYTQLKLNVGLKDDVFDK